MHAKPLIELDDVLLQHCGWGRVVTANERLAAALSDAYARDPARSGPLEGAPARVMALSDYLRDRYAALTRITAARSVLLSSDVQRLVWLEHAPDAFDIDLVDLYPMVADAWRTLHDWELTSALEHFDDNENHRLFRDWCRTYQNAARPRGWITEAELPAFIAHATREHRLEAEPLLLVGFDVVPRGLTRLIDAYRSTGAEVRHYAPNRIRTADITSVAYDDGERELRAAIYRARDVLAQTTEPVSICIAVPNLVDSHDRVVRQLDAILRPDDAEPTAATSPYNVSGGIALSAVPVIADAFAFLEWLFEPHYHTRIDALLRSPFLKLTANLGQGFRIPERSDAARFAALESASPLREIVRRAAQTGLVDLRTAVVGMRQLLDLAGWPNTAHLSSESFQAYRSFDALLEEFSRNAEFARPRHFAATIRQVRAVADRKLFAPERPAAPIQVLGYLEAVGLQFTHLWITGLNQAEWPASPSPTPFIPLRHLKAAGVPRCDADGEIVFARRLMAHWCVSASSVVFSHPLANDDIPSRRSTLVDEFAPSAEQHRDAAVLAMSHPYLIGRPSTLRPIDDEMDVGPARLDRLRHRGTGVLRDQSACPFRAFARYRLHAPQTITPHSFPDATDRGIATHAALRRLFERLPDVDLDRMDEQTLDEAVAEAVSIAIASLGAVPTPFRISERSRMTSLLFDWLRLERQRYPFRIAANESETVLSIGGIDFELRIDRVDVSSEDGGVLVIDYKTGPISPNVVIGVRPEEPQLPMYALSVPGVAAIAFACIRRNDCRLVGWSDGAYSAAPDTPGIRFNAPPADVERDWRALLDAWRASLSALATEFRVGIADVRPRGADACNECNLHALCRIREVRSIALD